jgi:hypothetical protein
LILKPIHCYFVRNTMHAILNKLRLTGICKLIILEGSEIINNTIVHYFGIAKNKASLNIYL